MPCAGATRPCVGRGRMLRREQLAGSCLMRGLAQPLTEVVQACFAPRVWVWGFLLGFALRCVALPCCACVRLSFCFRLVGLFFRLPLAINVVVLSIVKDCYDVVVRFCGRAPTTRHRQIGPVTLDCLPGSTSPVAVSSSRIGEPGQSVNALRLHATAIQGEKRL
jgi:hypothetical protein